MLVNGFCMKKDINSLILTKHEFKIMEAIWAKKEATVRDVYNVVSRKRKLSYSTISSEMRRLVRKGVLIRADKGKAYCYIPLLSRRQAITNHLKYLIDDIFEGDPEKLLEFIIRNMFELNELLSILYARSPRHSEKKEDENAAS